MEYFLLIAVFLAAMALIGGYIIQGKKELKQLRQMEEQQRQELERRKEEIKVYALAEAMTRGIRTAARQDINRARKEAKESREEYERKHREHLEFIEEIIHSGRIPRVEQKTEKPRSFQTVCRSCCAPVVQTGDKCPYCGTLYDPEQRKERPAAIPPQNQNYRTNRARAEEIEAMKAMEQFQVSRHNAERQFYGKVILGVACVILFIVVLVNISK